MAKHLVMVVHGIGEQQPGETVDQVLGGALAEHERRGGEACCIDDEVLELPESAFPDAPGDKTRDAILFPVHVRRVRPASPAPGDDRETVLAEVYWADKSPAPVGALWTIFDLIKIVTAIGYLALDNAENVKGGRAYKAVRLFLLAFFGIVTPTNALLLIGVLVLLLEGRAYDLTCEAWFCNYTADATVAVVGILTAVFGTWAYVARKDYYLWRVFGAGMWLWAAVTGLYVLIMLVRDTAETAQIDNYIGFIIGAMTGGWAIVVALCLAVYAIWAYDARSPLDDGVKGQRRIYAPICSAIVLLWMVIASAFWLAMQNLVGRLTVTGTELEPHRHAGQGFLFDAFKDHLGPALRATPVSVVSFLILLLVAAGLVVARIMHAQTLYRERPLIGRLLLNVLLQAAFAFSTLAITLVMLFIADAEFLGGRFFGWFGGIHDVLNSLFPVFSAALVALAVAAYNSPAIISGILGVVRDIVVYATTRDANTAMQDNPGNYPMRAEIEHRFRRVYERMCRQEAPDTLTVISHSQGTIVATRSLRRLIAEGAELCEGASLITMGSPVTHIYRRYFPRDFAVPDKRLGGTITWHNIFRTDDFVGTRIDVLTHGEDDFDVPAAGHTGYFTDAFVWRMFSDKVGFALIEPRNGAGQGEGDVA